LTVEIDPYINYFPNYIYLNPTPDYIEGMQLYNYTQARVWRWGAEAQVTYSFCRFLEASVKGEYLYARQLSGSKKGYTLPFSTPWSADVELRYKFGRRADGFVAVNAHVVGDQDEIVPPELPTDGHWTLNASAGKAFHIKDYVLSANLRAENLLNRRYYDHTSYYRLIGVPEPGINVQAMLSFEF
ncbi:MAG: TonB-dependent receptor, partial [Paludibacteraceae bacterium]|nr:TonB-dependent receptor [Paludibacteraceae bacterium]